MECPKCHKEIPDNSTKCPYCKKVLSLVCPNCRTIGHSAVCESCGYIILEKCSKCGNIVSTSANKCKCGFSTNKSVAYNECETDEFAAITLNFGSLKAIRKILASQDLFSKFKIRLKNLLTAQLKNVEGTVIIYGDTYVINFNKELSFPTSADKAVRTALKLINAFTQLNQNVVEELGTSLNINIKILKKLSDELLVNKDFNTKVKPLTIKKNEKKYLKGAQIVFDEYIEDVISKDYKTDSLYTVEEDGRTIVFYELKLENYIIPPGERKSEFEEEISEYTDTSVLKTEEEKEAKDLYDFKIFNIKAKCSFERVESSNIREKLGQNKIISIKGEKHLLPLTSDIVEYYSDKKVIRVVCSEEINYKPWGIFEEIFRQYYNLSVHRCFIPKNFDKFKDLFNLVLYKERPASTPEDARFAYMDDFIKFLSCLSDTVIIVEGFENIDDTTAQTLELFFDSYKNFKPDFVFITNQENAVHAKIKPLLRSKLYTEVEMVRNNMDSLVTGLKNDASDFIKSFYYEKIKSNLFGSKLYFDFAINYLKFKDVLVSFDKKLLVKNNDSVFLPSELEDLIKIRLKELSKNSDASMLLAYLALINTRLDYQILEKLGINELDKNIEILEKEGFIFKLLDSVYLNNCSLIKPVILSSLKKNAIEYLVKNILAKIGKGLDNTATLLLMGKIGLYNDEYLLLWKNSCFAIATGDYDSYLKNTSGFMTMLEHIKGNIAEDVIEENKKEVYSNILYSLYAYSPEKIYDIEQILLQDAMDKSDKESTVKLSNLMLQGALLSGKYGDALGLLNNILSNIPNPKLIVDDAINTKFFLLMLINIEILFNIGDLKSCIDISNELLDVLTPQTIEKIKPASFSINSFMSHLADTFRLGALAHILSLNSNLDEYYTKVEKSLGDELPEKEVLTILQDFLADKQIEFKNIEDSSPYSKIIYLIIQEFSEQNINYKNFAQNIYQAKLLASDISQINLEYFCEMLIAYAYSKENVFIKAEYIYRDLISKAETSANVNILLLAKYFLAKLKISKNEIEGALLIINDMLAFIGENLPNHNLMHALYVDLLINVAEATHINYVDIEKERNRLNKLIKNNSLAKITGILELQYE